MRTRWIGSLPALFLAAALAHAQPPAAELPPGPTPVAPAPGPSPPSPPVLDVGQPGPTGVHLPVVGTEPGDYTTHDRVWFNAEYLLWWVEGGRVPPLIGAIPASLAATTTPGMLLPQPPTVLFGDQRLGFPAFSGARITAGGWLDAGQYCGLEGSFFGLQRRTRSFAAQSTGDQVVGLFYADVTNGEMLTILHPIIPSQATETATASTSLRFWGAEANWRTRLNNDIDMPLDGLAGFRYLDLREDLSTSEAINFLGAGTQTFADHFTTANHFYAGQLGTSVDVRSGRWSIGVAAKIALGEDSQSIRISGSTEVIPLGAATQTFIGGVLTAPSNIGQFHRSRFAAMPEGNVRLGYQVTRYFEIYIAYNVLYLSAVARPGDVINFTVNPSNIRGLNVPNPSSAVRPLPVFNESDFWAQGMDVGLEFRY